MNSLAKLSVHGVAALLTLAFTSNSSVPLSVGVGDAPQYTFRGSLVNGMGVTSLEDLRGKPLLIDFWGIH
jgi:hypothetical protein